MRGAGSEGHPQIPRSRTDSRRPHLKRIHHPPCSAASLACSSDPNAEGGWGAGVQCPHPAPHQHIAARGSGASQELTLRQACPGPDGPGRNLRSKTRWFAGFCNSHHAPHFAAFFIGARAKISVAESHVVQGSNPRSLHPHSRPQNGMAPRPRRPTPDQPFLGALRARFGAHATPALCTTLLPARRRVPRTKWGRWRMRGRADAADQLWPSPPLCSTVTRSPVFPSTRSRQ